ncbi:E3 ubiquitin-protein ligase RNF138 [Spea bombifrons]|uniref:E3 ubiquitin-protein ligase RNF138 n=1 Tax=Spea bombifrons TaxID=233779 RepID=UPI00234BD805|nr:E3 ubiquitin-protein ligase RNF138 [Spea bombifrons]
MAEAIASTSSSGSSLKDFTCPVCKDVLQTPVRTQGCEHIFCRKCLVTATRTRGAICPLCRGAVSERDRFAPTRASDVEIEMKRLSEECMFCAKRVKLNYMRLHYKTCKKYQEEFGILPKDPVLQIKANPSKPMEPTYKCPMCENRNLSRRGLLDHCNNVHSHQIMEAVCPICVSLPLGDHYQRSGNIVGHLNARHRFNYEEYMNVHMDEEAQYQAAIEKSTQTAHMV